MHDLYDIDINILNSLKQKSVHPKLSVMLVTLLLLLTGIVLSLVVIAVM